MMMIMRSHNNTHTWRVSFLSREGQGDTHHVCMHTWWWDVATSLPLRILAGFLLVIILYIIIMHVKDKMTRVAAARHNVRHFPWIVVPLIHDGVNVRILGVHDVRVVTCYIVLYSGERNNTIDKRGNSSNGCESKKTFCFLLKTLLNTDANKISIYKYINKYI